MTPDETIGIIELEDSLAGAERPKEVPPGQYIGEIQDVQIPTSGKGNQYFAVTFVIPPDQLPADIRDDYTDGARLFWNRVLVPVAGNRRALYNLRLFVEALGLDANTTQVDPNEWMGRRAKLRVVAGTYLGETRAEIRAVEKAEEVAPRRQAPPQAAKPARAAARGRR